MIDMLPPRCVPELFERELRHFRLVETWTGTIGVAVALPVIADDSFVLYCCFRIGVARTGNPVHRQRVVDAIESAGFSSAVTTAEGLELKL